MIQIKSKENAKANAFTDFQLAANITDTRNNSIIHLFIVCFDQNKDEVNLTTLTWVWSIEFINYSQNGILPKNKNES